VDLQHISGLLRKLSPRQERVIRLFFGLGCQRPHSAREVAQECGVSAQVIAGLLGAALAGIDQSAIRHRDNLAHQCGDEKDEYRAAHDQL
jgi:DNA-directed RNA polymerase sigma subunit (sigma70/sigma32)